MAIRNIVNDYTSRKKDINLAYKVNGTAGQKPMDLRFGEISSYVAGIQKLIQRYAVCLFTNVGSQTDYPEFGTDFISQIQGCNLRSKQDYKHIFNQANWKVISEFRKYQNANPDQPKDEQLSTATLVSFSSLGGSLTFRVKLISLAGEIVDFLLPLPVVQ